MQGGKPPRPPVVSKRHPPCTDCTSLAVEPFLEHLQQLPWYNGQARPPAQAIVDACAAKSLQVAVISWQRRHPLLLSRQIAFCSDEPCAQQDLTSPPHVVAGTAL